MVATPIGNLRDLSFRALDILNEVDLILCEDTRKSRILFNEFNIMTKYDSLHEFTSFKNIEKYVSFLEEGNSIALISDAGTPLISDPGFEIVKIAKEKNIFVNPLPGPSSVISALVGSGLKIDKFIFEGFPPRKKQELENYLKCYLYEERTVVLFESPRRIKKLVQSVIEILGKDRNVTLAKEISKPHQKFISGSSQSLLNQIKKDNNLEKGEMVFLIEGTKEKSSIEDAEVEILVESLKDHLPLRKISKIISKISKQTSKEIYDTFKKK